MDIITIFNKYPTKKACLRKLKKVRWKNGITCPKCKSRRISNLKKEEFRYHCNACNRSFSVTSDTIFHGTKLSLQKWFLAISFMLNSKKGISSSQLARYIKVNKDTGWRILMQIRKAMREESGFLKGVVEADETYVGGKNRNRHFNKKVKGCQGRSAKDKVPVIGVIERGGKIRAVSAKDTTEKTLTSFIRNNVQEGSKVVTDEWKGYSKVHKYFEHEKVNHRRGKYVVGDAFTNTIENFWTQFKRGYVGQYHYIKDENLDMYLDEFCYRHNNRDNENAFEDLLERGLKIVL